MKYTKVIAAVLAILLSAGATVAYAKNQDDESENVKTVSASKTEETAPRKAGEGEPEKDETVYVLYSSGNDVKEVIVSDWLQNAKALESIADVSDLTNIENVKGYEDFAKDGENLTWNAKGADIYYQGKTDKELPMTVKITYFLDGKEMSAEEIAGKSGKVTIRYDYTNTLKSKQTVDGKEYEVCVPFLMASGTILD